MTPMQALVAATKHGAMSAKGLEEFGTIEAGKLADLVVLDRNPLENIRNTTAIRYVMKNGRLYNGNTLDEIWPRVRKAGSFYWQDDDPVEKQGYDTNSGPAKARSGSRGNR